MAAELSRYRFSRSVCHRMDLLGLRDENGEEIAGEGEENDDDDPQEEEEEPKSRDSLRCIMRSQSDHSRRCPGGLNPKVSYSKSLSFSHKSSATVAAALPASPRSNSSSSSSSSKSGIINKSSSSTKLRRMVSWSSYLLEAKGDETAVEEAEEWMVDLSQLLLGHRFACGAHSRLYHGIYQGKPVAVKVIRQPQGADTAHLKITLNRLFSREVSLLSRLHHPNIVQLIGACRRPQVCCVITEYLAGGSLRDFLSTKSGPSPLPAQTIVAMALDVARGMSYLHSQGVVHRDLKSANLILTHDLCVKISDFGVATLEPECNNVTPDVGTYRWMAPELVNRKAHSRKVDMYSYGVVLWELVTGRLPFHNMTPVQAAYAVVNKNARPEVPPNCPTVLSHLMQQCWSLHPDRRPDFDQIIVALERFQASIEGDLGLASWQTPMQQLDNFSR